MFEYRRKCLIIVCGILMALAPAICFPVQALSANPEKLYSVHAASYQRKSGAVSDANRFRALGYESFYRQSEVPGKGTWYRVYVGRFAGESEARLFGEKLKSKAVLNYYSIQKFDAAARAGKPPQTKTAAKPKAAPAAEPASPDSKTQKNVSPTRLAPLNSGDAQTLARPAKEPAEPVRTDVKPKAVPAAEPAPLDSETQKNMLPSRLEPPNSGDSQSADHQAAGRSEVNAASAEKAPDAGLPANPLFEKARKAFESSDYQGALEILSAMESDPGSTAHQKEWMLRRLADCHYFLAPRQGNSYFLIATERYKKILLEYPDSPQNVHGFYRMGKSYENLKFYYEALEAYRLLAANFPDAAYSAEANFKIGEMLHKIGRFDQAVDHLKKWQLLYPADIHAKTAAFLIADSYYQTGQAVNAENRYREAMQRWPDYGDIDLELLLNMGMHHNKNRQYADSVHAFSLAASLHPDDARIPDILCALGSMLQDAGRPQGAFLMLGSVMEKYPKTSNQAARHLADMGIFNPGMRALGFAGADAYMNPIETYGHLIAKSGGGEQTAALMAQKADALRKTGQLEKCIDAYSELLEKFQAGPHEEESRHHLKTAAQTLIQRHFQEGKDLAVADIYLKTYGRNLMRFDGQDMDAGLMLGASLVNAGMPRIAKTVYSELRSICRDAGCSGRIALGAARADAADGLKQDAAKSLLALIADPAGLTAGQVREAKVLAADILFDLKRYGEAANFYGEVLNGECRAPERRICLQHAAALRHAGKIDASFEAYRKIMERFLKEGDAPQNQWVQAYAGLGQCSYLQKRYNDGIAFFEKALAHSNAKDKAWTLYQLIFGLLQANNRPAAEKRLAELRQTDEFWAQAAQRWIEESNWRETNQPHLP